MLCVPASLVQGLSEIYSSREPVCSYSLPPIQFQSSRRSPSRDQRDSYSPATHHHHQHHPYSAPLSVSSRGGAPAAAARRLGQNSQVSYPSARDSRGGSGGARTRRDSGGASGYARGDRRSDYGSSASNRDYSSSSSAYRSGSSSASIPRLLDLNVRPPPQDRRSAAQSRRVPPAESSSRFKRPRAPAIDAGQQRGSRGSGRVRGRDSTSDTTAATRPTRSALRREKAAARRAISLAEGKTCL